jgi:succinyl-CoA synthetase alpha subunit
MAPSLEEATNGSSAPVDTPVVNAPAPAPEEGEIAVISTAGAHSQVKSAGPPIPGPLGIESASLKGKVALVTGSGTPIQHQDPLHC